MKPHLLRPAAAPAGPRDDALSDLAHVDTPDSAQAGAEAEDRVSATPPDSVPADGLPLLQDTLPVPTKTQSETHSETPAETQAASHPSNHRADVAARWAHQQGVVRRDRSPLAETFKMLRNQVLQRLRPDGHNLLAVTSPRAIEGKSLTALNLALTLAAEIDTEVLLVDADLSGQGLQARCGLLGLPGLGEYLLRAQPPSESSLAEYLVHTGVERLQLLPAGQGAGLDSAERLASRAAQQWLQSLQQHDARRIVIFDLPPVLDTADAIAFLPLVQATLLVVEEHTTTRGDLLRCGELLAPFKLIGSVMSQAPPVGAAARRRGWLGWS